jgi:hypothetical protein
MGCLHRVIDEGHFVRTLRGLWQGSFACAFMGELDVQLLYLEWQRCAHTCRLF